MFLWALGVVGYISEVGLGKVLQDAADQRGILPLFISSRAVCLVCAVSGWWFCLTLSSPAKQKRGSYFAEL